MRTAIPAAVAPADELHDPEYLRPGATDALLGSAPWRRLAVLGDSIAAGVGDPAPGYRDLSWADRLAAALGRSAARVGRTFSYLNTGVPAVGAQQVRRDQLARVAAFAPDLAVVAAGANDALRRTFDARTVEREIDGIVGPLAQAGCLVITFGLFDLSRTGFVPSGMRADLRRRLVSLNEVSRAVAGRHGGLFVDFLDHPAVDDALSADMLHPDRRGHAQIAAAVACALAGRVARDREAGRRIG